MTPSWLGLFHEESLHARYHGFQWCSVAIAFIVIHIAMNVQQHNATLAQPRWDWERRAEEQRPEAGGDVPDVGKPWLSRVARSSSPATSGFSGLNVY